MAFDPPPHFGKHHEWDMMGPADNKAPRKAHAKGVAQVAQPPNPRLQGVVDYTLMLKNEPVFAFRYDHDTERVVAIDNILNPQLAPVGACSAPNEPDAATFARWLADRAVPENRFDWDYMRTSEGIPSPAALLFAGRGMGLLDQYWFKPAGVDIDWHDINYFENDFDGDIEGYGPSSATPGELFAWWECRNGTRFLLQIAEDGEREPYAEKATSALYRRLLAADDFVPSDVEENDYGTCVIRPAFVDADTQFVPMRDLARCYLGDEENVTYGQCRDLLLDLGIPHVEQQLAKMIVCDFLVANIGRSLATFGVIRSSNDGRFLRMAPLFGNIHSFYHAVDLENDFQNDIYPYRSAPFSRFPTMQVKMAEDLTWFDPDQLDEFEDEIAEILEPNDARGDWFPEAAANQFIFQYSFLVEILP